MIEIPQAGKIRSGKWINLFRAMKNVGDNFFVPFKTKGRRTFGATITMCNKKLKPLHFVSRCRDAKGNKEMDKGKPGFRVWRDK